MPNLGSNIKESQLTPNSIVFVRGNITFARLTSHIEGDELKKDQKRRESRGQIPIDKPYTTVTVTNAKIQQMQQGVKTNEEQFVEGKFYYKNDNPSVYNYTVNSKSPFLPYVSQAVDGDISNVNEIAPEGELDNGLDVILVLRIFQTKGFNGRKGVSLDGVICVDPIRYYGTDSAKNRLAECGITFNALPADQKPAVQTPAPATQTEAPAPAQAAAPAPTVSAPAPNENQFAANANPMPAPAAPAAPAEPATASTGWTCPSCGFENAADMNFCGQCGTHKPESSKPGIQY